MAPSSTRVARQWLSSVADRRAGSTHAIWYTDAEKPELALFHGEGSALAARRAFEVYAASEEETDRDTLRAEIIRLTAATAELETGWPEVKGGDVYAIPGGPVVRVLNRLAYVL